VLASSDGDTILTADGDEINLAMDTSQKRVRFADIDGRYLHDSGIRLRIGDSISTGAWAMEAFTLAYQVLPGLARRRGAALNP
jgi:endonuclease YncB( thermonuclease family)